MPSRSLVPLACLLVCRSLAGAEPPFATELSLGFGYEGSAAARPVVVLDGTPSASYAYSADGRAHTMEAAATRWLAPVADDGRTPFALLPFVARVSSVSARFALTGASRDSLGSFAGQVSSLEVSFAGDGTIRDGGLSAEWFLGRSLSLRGGLGYVNERETAASISVESPSGRAEVSTSGTRASSASGTLGVALRLGEHELGATGSYGESDLTRDDASAFTGSAQPFFSTLRTDGVARSGTIAARLLFLERRLVLDVSGTWARSTSSSDLESALSGPFSKGTVIGRRAVLEATWFATRRLGLSAGFAHATSDVTSGSPGRERPSSEQTTRAFGARAVWFASGRVSVSLSGERVETDTVVPPASTTYQRFDETTTRLNLGAAVRF
ncbi:MAG: TonB-dependent receptor [Thermoanaerobaculia bacterium]